MASSFLSDHYALATDQLQALYTTLPPGLRSYLSSALDLVLPHQKQAEPLSVLERITQAYSTGSYTTLLAVFGPFCLLIYSLMSWWPNSGRYSPFQNFYTRSGPPQVTEDDYSYLSGESDHRYPNSTSYGGNPSHMNSTSHHHPPPQHYRGNSSSSTHRPSAPTNVAPDQINLRHRSNVYQLHFPAFSISEEKLKIRDLRATAATALRVDDPSRIKLLYKGKQLRDNTLTCRQENLKQNSEVMCVVSNEAASNSSDDDDIDDDEDSSTVSAANNSGDGVRSGEDGSGSRRRKRKNHRSKKPKASTSTPSSAPAHPLADASTHINLAPPTISTQNSSRNASPAPRKPSSPAEMLSDLESLFQNTYMPMVSSFLASPPPDPKIREQEWRKISETIMTQVLLKLDGVETGGEEGLRFRRKDLVRRIQEALGEIDAVGKPR